MTLEQVFDGNNNLVSQERYTCDQVDEETSTTDGDGNTTTYTLNADGQVTHEETRDASGNLVSQSQKKCHCARRSLGKGDEM